MPVGFLCIVPFLYKQIFIVVLHFSLTKSNGLAELSVKAVDLTVYVRIIQIVSN